MRAIITCSCDIQDDDDVLKEILDAINWWPRLPQDHEEVKDRKNDILTHISEDDKAVAEGTFVCVIYDEKTRSWGIVSRPTKQAITFRIKHQVSERLKEACESLVKKLQELKSIKHKDKDVLIHFKFEQHIQVLERESVTFAFSGKVLSLDPWKRVKDEKGGEILLIYWSLGIGVLLLFITTPWVRDFLQGGTKVDGSVYTWFHFLMGFCDRVSSSAFVTIVVTGLNVYFQYLNIRKLTNIKWMLN